MVNPQLQAALQALYHLTDPSVKAQANDWLDQWQQSQDAWQGAHEVLQAPDAGLEAHYFAAQTLRTKVQRDYEELPGAAALSLRDSLLALLTRYAQGSPPVRTQLSLALAALAARLPAAQWGPSGVVGWLVQRLGSEPAEISVVCMLELLTVLPQEASGYQPALRPSQRLVLRDEMVAAVPQALSVLASCLAQGGPRAREQVLEAFAAWLKLSAGEALTGTTLLQSPLVAASLEGLRSSESFHAAVDAVIEIIYCTSQRGRPRDDMAPVVQALVPEVMNLRPRFHVAAQQAAAEREGRTPPESEHDDAEEEAKAMARLFAEVGEAYTDLIAGGGPEVLSPVQALLDVAAHPDDAICCISFNFWHRLSRALTVGLHPEPLSTPEPALPEEERRRRLAVFTPTFEQLVTLIRGRVRFPDDFDTRHRDERLDFKHGRVAVGDTLMDAAAVLGGDVTLRLLAEPLLQLSARVGAGGEFDWRTAEAALYCIRCVHRGSPPPGDALLLSLFAALPSLPAPPPLAYTTALTVGAYSDWLADTARTTPDVQRLLGQLMEMLIKGLGNSESAAAAALSIRRLCDGCASLLGASMPSLLQLYQKVQVCGDVAEESDDAFVLDEEDVQQVVEAVVRVASALPNGERQRCVQQMMDIVVQPMQQILGTPGAVPGGQRVVANPARLPLVLPLAERVTTIFRAVCDPADVAEALVRLWPWLEAALDAFGADVAAAEKICKAPRYAVRSAGKAAQKAVAPLAAALPPRFEATGHSCYLFVASELVKTFGDEPQFDGYLGPMLARMLMTACTALRTLAEVTSKPDIADDTFLLAGRGLSYAPRLIITPQLLPVLLSTVRAGLLVQHRDACCSMAAFMVRLLDPATHRKCPPEQLTHLQTALVAHAPAVVRLLLAGVTGALPASRLQELTDVLYAILKVTTHSGLGWTRQVVAVLPEEAAAPADKQRFLAACETVVAEGIAVDDERLLLDAMAELSELCRRSRRAQQAAQHALLHAE